MPRFALLLVLAWCLLLPPPARADQVRDLTAPEVRQLVEEEGALPVHVLSRIEFDMQHLPGSINIPVTEVAASDALPPDRERPLVEAEEPATVAAPAGTEDLAGLRLLLVDDNEINREVALMTRARTHTVTPAGPGLEALVLLAQTDVDAVLMDVQMPDMDGLTATAAIRAAEGGLPPRAWTAT